MSLIETSTIAGFSFAADQCVNPQDALVIQLFIEGVEIHEIVYLRKDSLDVTSNALTIRSGTDIVRRHKISQKCAELFHYAIHQTKYFVNNGIKQTEHCAVTLKETIYAVKPSLHDYVANECLIQEMDSIILRTIYNRCKILAEIFGIPELAYLTTVRHQVEEAYA